MGVVFEFGFFLNCGVLSWMDLGIMWAVRVIVITDRPERADPVYCS